MILPPIKALGTMWHIEVFDAVCNQEKLHTDCTKWLCEYEARYSRFLAHSWLSTLNKEKAFHSPDQQFIDLLQQSLEYYEKTNGIFNIAIGEKLVNAGYDATYSFTSGKQEIVVPELPKVLTVTNKKITLSGGQLDLGGIGKGYAIDALANYLQAEHGLSYFLINGGGDMYATSDNEQPIKIELAHPHDNTLSIGNLELHNSGFASSSPNLRAWLDSKTGVTQNHLLTAGQKTSYIVSSSATEADVWATTLCLDQAVQLPKHVRALVLDKTTINLHDRIFNVYSKPKM